MPLKGWNSSNGIVVIWFQLKSSVFKLLNFSKAFDESSEIRFSDKFNSSKFGASYITVSLITFMIFFERSTLCNFCPNGNENRLSSAIPTPFANRWVMLLFIVIKMLLGISCKLDSSNIKHLKSWTTRSKLSFVSCMTCRSMKTHESSILHLEYFWKSTLVPTSEHRMPSASEASVKIIIIESTTKNLRNAKV